MTCTLYDDPIGYNAPIAYNGVCVSPNPPVPGGGFSDFFAVPFPDDDEEGLMIALLGLLEDDK